MSNICPKCNQVVGDFLQVEIDDVVTDSGPTNDGLICPKCMAVFTVDEWEEYEEQAYNDAMAEADYEAYLEDQNSDVHPRYDEG